MSRRAAMRWVRRRLRAVQDMRDALAQRWARFLLSRNDDEIERHVAARMFLRGLPSSLRMKFRSADAVVDGEDLTAVIAMTIVVGDEPHHLEISIAQRRCMIRRAEARRPDVSMRLRLSDLIRMSSGAVTGPLLMADGRMAVSGDPFLLARFPGLFGLTTRSVLR